MLIIEGVSCTGKTTLCEELAKSHGFFLAEEGVRYLERSFNKRREEIMGIPASLEEERRNQDLLFNAEYEKLKAAFRARRDRNKVVLDKSALSILSSAYAFNHIEGMFGDVRYATGKLVELVSAFGVEDLRNVKIALLELDQATRQERRLKRDTVLDDTWLDKEVCALQNHFMSELISLGLIDGRVFRGDDKDLVNKILSFYEE